MSEGLVEFTLFYFLLCICLVCPPTEFVSAGLTLPALFSRFIGSEFHSFTTHHLKRSSLTLLCYSLLPLAYVFLLYLLDIQQIDTLLTDSSSFWRLVVSFTVASPLVVLFLLKNWYSDNYERHPIALNLAKFANNNNTWRSVASDIDIEYRRVDKIVIQLNSLTKLIVTENWILKVCPLTVLIAHQSDSSLVVKDSDVHTLSSDSEKAQYLHILVKSSRLHVESFPIRINARHFKDLENKLARSIAVMPEIKFYKTVTEEFVDVFKEVIRNNPKYSYGDRELEPCIGCLQARANVKLQRLCVPLPGEAAEGGRQACEECYCRPMWCDECLARWFASRQDGDKRGLWLKAKCSCPMCRATFCLLDVCYLAVELPVPS